MPMQRRRLESHRPPELSEDSRVSAMDRRVAPPWLTRERAIGATVLLVLVVGARRKPAAVLRYE